MLYYLIFICILSGIGFIIRCVILMSNQKYPRTVVYTRGEEVFSMLIQGIVFWWGIYFILN